jgi:hypothetical protein
MTLIALLTLMVHTTPTPPATIVSPPTLMTFMTL